jgi:hypothetical protein
MGALGIETLVDKLSNQKPELPSEEELLQPIL